MAGRGGPHSLRRGLPCGLRDDSRIASLADLHAACRLADHRLSTSSALGGVVPNCSHRRSRPGCGRGRADHHRRWKPHPGTDVLTEDGRCEQDGVDAPSSRPAIPARTAPAHGVLRSPHLSLKRMT